MQLVVILRTYLMNHVYYRIQVLLVAKRHSYQMGHENIQACIKCFDHKFIKEGPLTTSNQLLFPYTVALRLR